MEYGGIVFYDTTNIIGQLRYASEWNSKSPAA